MTDRDHPVDTVSPMSVRGLAVALLCGLLGLGGGDAVAYLAQPHTSYSAAATPVPGVSPSLPIDVVKPYRTDIDYPPLEPGFPLQAVHTFTNDLAQWTFHVPLGWKAYAVCG